MLAIPAIKQMAISIKCRWAKLNSSRRKGTYIAIARKTKAPPTTHQRAELGVLNFVGLLYAIKKMNTAINVCSCF
jgi:hypothetical protein